MVRSILLAIDDTEPSRAAQELAIEIAVEHQARVTGVAVVDRPWITTPTATPIGGGAYKQHRDEVLLGKNRAAVEQRLAEFHERCASSGIRSEELHLEGVPHERIEQESCRHDLIVIGRDTDFHDSEFPDIADTVTRLLHDNPRPIMVVPAQRSSRGSVVVAFDGGLQASRAAHIALLLGLAREDVHVVSIAGTESEARDLAGRAVALFAAHGVPAVAHGLASDGNPADALVRFLSPMQTRMLVMGAFSKRGLMHRIFVGSATHRLLEACPAPLFVYH